MGAGEQGILRVDEADRVDCDLRDRRVEFSDAFAGLLYAIMFALRSSRQLCRSVPRLVRLLAHDSTPGRSSEYIRPADSEAWVEATHDNSIKPESPAPWFLDPEDTAEPTLNPLDETPGRGIPQPKRAEVRPLPEGVPDALVHLHKQLLLSPLIEPSELLVREPITMPLGPVLPDRIHGARRKRGSRSMDLGTTLPLSGGGVWDWIVLVQVCQSYRC